jgi:hypothetical protein
LLYWKALKNTDSEKTLYLAVPNGFYQRFFDDPFFIDVATTFDVKMLVFDEIQPCINQWIK